jgi:leucyl-tRNA---protein transferase
MRHTLPIAPQFYVTAPQPCPYLEGRMERKLFTALQGDHAQRLNDTLSKQGFRRSQNVLYRPSCAECSACLSARIRVADFVPARTHKKILRRNADLVRNATSPWDMDIFEFAAMIEETPVKSRVLEYTRPDDAQEQQLTAVCLTDVFDDGLSLVYSFYDPGLPERSLGTQIILDHVDIARDAGLPYVYLGYWVPGSRKMGYKAGFSALEIYKGGQWQDLGDPIDHRAELHPLSVDPIAEQVARINLPDTRAVRD